MFIYEAKNISMNQIVKMNLKYDFDLERLCHKISNEIYMKNIDFYLICNAVDKSIWVAFDFESMTEIDEIDSMWSKYDQVYEKLSRDTQNMMIEIMRIFESKWTARRSLSLNDEDLFKNGTDTSLACRLIAKQALISNVLNVIKTDETKSLHSKQRSYTRSKELEWGDLEHLRAASKELLFDMNDFQFICMNKWNSVTTRFCMYLTSFAINRVSF
jgi:hypothetical protein